MSASILPPLLLLHVCGDLLCMLFFVCVGSMSALLYEKGCPFSMLANTMQEPPGSRHIKRPGVAQASRYCTQAAQASPLYTRPLDRAAPYDPMPWRGSSYSAIPRAMFFTVLLTWRACPLLHHRGKYSSIPCPLRFPVGRLPGLCLHPNIFQGSP